MKDNKFNLAVLHHEEVFETRDLALEYLSNNYKPKSLDGEPLIVKYGENENPNVILAFGTSNDSPGSFFAIDMTKANEDIENLLNTIGDDKEKVDFVDEILNGVVKATGLTLDLNKIEDKISYDTDPRDNVIGDASDMADAIDKLSKYAQSNNLSVENTNSVNLTYEENLGGGKTLKADVNISTENSDDVDFNNNIIGIKHDGLYAASHLAYDDARHELIFTTSGYKNNRFQDDAIVQKVNLGQHTKVLADNDGNSVKLEVEEDAENYTTTLKANLQISDRENNILKVSDGKAYVEGLSRNIKYGDKTVAGQLTELVNKTNELETMTESASKTAHVEGGQTDTLETTVSTLADGGAKVTGNVRLSSDNSIVVRDGGLAANVTVDVDTATNKLIVTIGDRRIEKTLPGVELFESAEYNDANEELIITFKTGSELVIPIHSIIHTWETDNDETSPITLQKNVVTGDVDKLSANIKLRSTDNLIGVENGKLYVSEQTIDNKVATETSRATTAENGIRTSVQNLSNNIEQQFDEVSETINSVKDDLATETNRAETAENALDDRLDNLQQVMENEIARATAAEQSNSERIADLAAEVGDIPEYTAGNGLRLNNTEFSVKINEDSESYLTVSEEGIKLLGIDAALDEKANASDVQSLTDNVYTKAESDAKYLTEHQDISNLATKASLQETDDKANQNAADIASLAATVDNMAFEIDDTNTLDLTMDVNHVLTGDVKIKTTQIGETPNIIKSDANGIYATVTLSYNKPSNILVFNDGNGEKRFELNNFGILQDAFYESATKKIVLIVKKDDETTERIEFPVNDLVNTWTVEDIGSPVILAKRTEQNGDVLSADIRIHPNPRNLLTVNSNSLFVNSDADAHFALWGNTETTVQGALNEIYGKVQEIDAIADDINDIEQDITDLNGDLSALQTQVTTNTQNITNIQGSVNTLQQSINNLETRLTTAEQNALNAKNLAQEAKDAADELAEQLATLSQQLGDRLTALENALTELNNMEVYAPNQF